MIEPSRSICFRRCLGKAQNATTHYISLPSLELNSVTLAGSGIKNIVLKTTRSYAGS